MSLDSLFDKTTREKAKEEKAAAWWRMKNAPMVRLECGHRVRQGSDCCSAGLIHLSKDFHWVTDENGKDLLVGHKGETFKKEEHDYYNNPEM